MTTLAQAVSGILDEEGITNTIIDQGPPTQRAELPIVQG
jgi:hypothetical protein